MWIKKIINEIVVPIVDNYKDDFASFMKKQKQQKQRKQLQNKNKAKKIAIVFGGVISEFIIISTFASLLYYHNSNINLIAFSSIAIGVIVFWIKLFNKKTKKYREKELELIFFDLLDEYNGKISEMNLLRESKEEVEYIQKFLMKKLNEIPHSEITFNDDGDVFYNFPYK